MAIPYQSPAALTGSPRESDMRRAIVSAVVLVSLAIRASAQAQTDSPAPGAATPRPPPTSDPPAEPESLLSGLSSEDTPHRGPWFFTVSMGPFFSGALIGTPATGVGLQATAEYGAYLDWFSPRAYAGTILTFPVAASCGASAPCDASAKLAIVGIRGRFEVSPPPFFSVFADLGVGASFGEMTTQTPELNESWSGARYHIPMAFGIAWGEAPRAELTVSSLIHPGQNQVLMGLTFSMGLSI